MVSTNAPTRQQVPRRNSQGVHPLTAIGLRLAASIHNFRAGTPLEREQLESTMLDRLDDLMAAIDREVCGR